MKPKVRIEPLPPLVIERDGHPAGSSRWKVHWRERIYHNGKAKSVRRAETFYTKAEAEAKWLEKQRSPTAERLSVTVEELVEAFRDAELRHMHDTTQNDYRFIIDYYILPKFRYAEIDTLSPAE